MDGCKRNLTQKSRGKLARENKTTHNEPTQLCKRHVKAGSPFSSREAHNLVADSSACLLKNFQRKSVLLRTANEESKFDEI